MTWLVWRQHRKQVLVLFIALAALAAVLIPTGRQARRAIAAYQRCLDGLGTADLVASSRAEACQALSDKFAATHTSWAYAGILLLFLPLVVGLFWGAPLVAREVEQGTHRMVWTQGVSRTRWMLTKLGLLGAVLLLFATAYAWLVSWWYEPMNRAITVRMDDLFFDEQGVVPVAYTLFAVAVGVFAGTVTRKVLPAMATTLVVFLAARLAVFLLVRPNIQEPLTHTVPVAGTTPLLPNPALGDWILSSGVYNADGSLRSVDSTAFCIPAPDGGACRDTGQYNRWVFQPGDRFWLFQWVEAGLFAVLAVALLYAALVRVQRHLS
jgi:hypothetical protein